MQQTNLVCYTHWYVDDNHMASFEGSINLKRQNLHTKNVTTFYCHSVTYYWRHLLLCTIVLQYIFQVPIIIH